MVTIEEKVGGCNLTKRQGGAGGGGGGVWWDFLVGFLIGRVEKNEIIYFCEFCGTCSESLKYFSYISEIKEGAL